MGVDLQLEKLQLSVKLLDFHLPQSLALEIPFLAQLQRQGESHIEQRDREIVKRVLEEWLCRLVCENREIGIVRILHQHIKGKAHGEAKGIGQKFLLLCK